MAVTFWIPAVTFEWPPREVRAPVPPSTEELQTGLKALKRSRRRCQKLLARMAPNTEERARFEKRVGKILGDRWTETRTRKGRKPDLQREDKMEMVYMLRRAFPRPTWNEITEKINVAFGTEYSEGTLRQYFADWKREHKHLVA